MPLSTRSRSAVVACALALGVTTVLGSAAHAAPADPPVPHTKLSLRDGTLDIRRGHAARSAPQAATATVPSYTTSNVDATTKKSYTAHFVGASPSSNSSSTVTVNIVPLNFALANSNGTTTTVTSTAAASAVAGSPMFTNTTTKPAGETTQYLDAYVRANANKVGSNYHLLLDPIVAAPVSVSVPAGQWQQVGGEYGVLDTAIENAVTSNAVSGRYPASQLTMFVAPNVYGDDGSFTGSGFGGYHDQSGNHTFGYSDIEGNNTNLQAFSHEIAEWAMDPFVGSSQINLVPGASVSGYGCLTNLEVGDPVYTSTFTQTVGATTWQLEDEVYVPWFFHTSPSTSYGRKYSLLGISSPAASC